MHSIKVICIFASENYNCIRMIKKILLISIVFTLTFCFPLVSKAQNIKDDVENVQLPKIVVYESTVHVSGANGETLQVFNVTGVSVARVKIDSADKHIDLNLQKGCYILKVGKVVRKIYIK